jgi:glucokinase
MLLAGDIGGTKTLLGLFDASPTRPRSVAMRSFVTLEFDGLSAIIEQFTRDQGLEKGAITAACFGVAGPVLDGSAVLTNVPWNVDARQIAEAFALERVDLLNDVQAMAYGLTVLDASEVLVLQKGRAVEGGGIALIAAGTGLGIATMHRLGDQYVSVPTESGHADFAARTAREVRLMQWLTDRDGRAEVEGVVSGRGVLNIHRALHRGLCLAVRDLDHPDAAADITAAGLAGRCAGCVEILDIFVEAYGAEAGNLALRSMSTGGMFVGGGIAPKILPALTDGRFMRAFRHKAPFEELLSVVPVNVVLNPDTALLGAAVHAAQTLLTDGHENTKSRNNG